jgi:hypothetical protein
MALNPFEQLRLITVEPRNAFEEIVGILLLDHGRSDGQVKVHLGDAGVDSYKGRFGEGGELTVYNTSSPRRLKYEQDHKPQNTCLRVAWNRHA